MNNVLVAKRKAAHKRKMRSAAFRRFSILAVLILGVYTVKMIGQTGETDFLIPKSNVVQDLNDEIVGARFRPSFKVISAGRITNMEMEQWSLPDVGRPALRWFSVD